MLVPPFAGADSFGGTQELYEPVEGKSRDGAKSNSPSFPTGISFSQSEQGWVFCVFPFFSPGGSDCLSVSVKNVPDLIYVPLV